MKHYFLVACGLLLANSAMADVDRCLGLTGCDRKECILEVQQEYAAKHGNKYRNEGLQKALNSVERYCSDDSLKQRQQSAIEERERDVEYRQDDLKMAKGIGDSKKIKKAEEKLAKAKEKVTKAKEKFSRIWK